MYELPTTIDINEQSFTIRNRGDYRMVLDCFDALNDADISQEERIYSALIIFYDCLQEIEDIENIFGDFVEEAILKMFDFFNCGQENSGYMTNKILVDWKKDSQIITAAVNNVAGKEVRAEPYLHWWTFMGYYISIGESVFSTVVSIRDKITKCKKLDKFDRKFQVENPSYFKWNSKPVSEIEADREVFELWNSGK